MNLFVSTYATQRYCYALPNFGRRVASAIAYSKVRSGTFLFVGDNSDKTKQHAEIYIKNVLPDGWKFIYEGLSINDEEVVNYKEDAQLLIAQLQSKAFTTARQQRATHFWSVESDVLVQPNSLTVALDCINFDNGYYDVSMCSYPSQGGGPYLGGRGTVEKHIEDDIHKDERKIPPEITKELKEVEKKLEKLSKETDWSETLDAQAKEIFDKKHEIEEKIKGCEPIGNVYGLNAKTWRKRGWMEYAYPSIGKGAIVPTDWIGFGCTLFNEKALNYAHFDGYEGKGTQDLYVGWFKFYQNDIRMCVTTHSICDHAIRKRKGEDQLWDDFVLVNAYHETEGDFVGHLRQRHTHLYNFVEGEKPVELKKEPKQNKKKSKS